MSVKEKQLELIQNIAELAEELGWKIVIPKNDDADIVAGLIMGSEKFFEEVVHMNPEDIEEVIEFDSVAARDKKNVH